MPIKVHNEHIVFIRDLFRERFTVLELHQMYEGFITYGQIRAMVRGVQQKEKTL